MVFVLAGLSPGAGALIGGRLHRGYGGAAGEIGALHLLGREATPETLLSTTDEPLHPLDEQAVAMVFAQARDGDQRARAAVDRFIRRLVHDVGALVLALDPELVVIGGWAAGLDGVLEPLRRELSRYCLRPPRVTLSLLGEAAVATGPCGWPSTMSRSSCSRWRAPRPAARGCPTVPVVRPEAPVVRAGCQPPGGTLQEARACGPWWISTSPESPKVSRQVSAR